MLNLSIGGFAISKNSVSPAALDRTGRPREADGSGWVKFRLTETGEPAWTVPKAGRREQCDLPGMSEARCKQRCFRAVQFDEHRSARASGWATWRGPRGARREPRFLPPAWRPAGFDIPFPVSSETDSPGRASCPDPEAWGGMVACQGGPHCTFETPPERYLYLNPRTSLA